MLTYRVFQQTTTGELNYSGTGRALGAGPNELSRIVDGHQLRAGDMIYINGDWTFIEAIRSSTNWRERPVDLIWRYLDMCELCEFTFAGVPWSPAMATRLMSQAARMEKC